MAIIISDSKYTIILGADNNLFMRTRRRHIQFDSYKALFDMSNIVVNTMQWRMEHFPERYQEQEEDGLLQAFCDYNAWYLLRKSRALTHLRMVAKLLYWHRQSVEKLWDPADPENIPRINEMFLHEV